LELAAKGNGAVTIPEGIQETCRCGTSKHGLAGTVVLGGWLNLEFLEVFSNLNDSMILIKICHFYQSKLLFPGTLVMII